MKHIQIVLKRGDIVRLTASKMTVAMQVMVAPRQYLAQYHATVDEKYEVTILNAISGPDTGGSSLFAKSEWDLEIVGVGRPT